MKTFAEKSQPLIFEKYADGFDSNGFANDIMAPSKPDVNTLMTGGKSDSPMEFNDVYLEAELKKMTEEFTDLNSLFGYDYGEPVENSSLAGEDGGGVGSVSGVVSSGVPSVPAEDIEMDPTYFKENLLSAAKAAQKNKNISKNFNSKTNNSPNPEIGGTSKVNYSEDIDCVVENCTILKRMNSLNDNGNSVKGTEELVEITDIIPTNSYCSQLLVKIVKTKASKALKTSKLIMANVSDAYSDNDGDNDDNNDNESNDECQSSHSRSVSKKSVGGQLLLFDCNDGTIPNEHKKAITFSRAKCPKDICILPNFQLTTDVISEKSLAECNNGESVGAFTVVCADGGIELFSLNDFQLISSIKEEQHHFIAVTYCRSLERLCCCTKEGALIFYSLNDSDESGDEMIDMEEENCTGIAINESCAEFSVTDGANSNQQSHQLQQQHGGNNPSLVDDMISQSNLAQHPFSTNIKVDCGSSQNSASGTGVPASPSPSSMNVNPATSNLLAYRNGELTLDELRSLYALTLFDEKSIPYTAEVPSCWNNLVQAQKQRKQSQHTWRLHNDA